MAKAPLTSIRSNSLPPGGVTALQSMAPEQVPAEIVQLLASMSPLMSQFRQQSTPQTVKLGSLKFESAGEQDFTRITSVGLGWRIRSHHSVEFLISNTAGTAQVININKHFPYCLLTNTKVEINGSTSTYSASGKSGLVVYGRNKRGFFNPQNNALSQSLVRVSFGAGITPTASSTFSFSGYDSMSIAANTNNATLQVDFYTFEKVAYNEDTLLGALPLQNNSVYAQLTRTIASTFTGTNQKAPFYIAGTWPGTTTLSLNSYNIDQWYDYWGVPNNPALYAPMVNNSYQVQEQPNVNVAATGEDGFVYDFPLNQFLVATHLFGKDSTFEPVAWDTLNPLKIIYNGGSIIPVVIDAGNARSEQYADYGADIFAVPGYRLWDGDATTDSIVTTDEAGWLDTYNAANPQMTATVSTSASIPLLFDITREVVISGAVQTVG